MIKENALKVIERTTRANLRTLPEAVRGSPVARLAVELARRLDGEPADTAFVLLSREFRQAMADVYRQANADLGGELDQFLARISTPAFGDGAH